MIRTLTLALAICMASNVMAAPVLGRRSKASARANAAATLKAEVTNAGFDVTTSTTEDGNTTTYFGADIVGLIDKHTSFWGSDWGPSLKDGGEKVLVGAAVYGLYELGDRYWWNREDYKATDSGSEEDAGSVDISGSRVKGSVKIDTLGAPVKAKDAEVDGDLVINTGPAKPKEEED